MPTWTPTQTAINLVNLVASNLAGTTAPTAYANLQNTDVLQTPHRAIADAYLSSVGYQAQSDGAGLGTATTNATSFADVGDGTTTGFATWTYTIPVTKTYLLLVGLSCWVTVGGYQVIFQTMVDGSAPSGQPGNAQKFFFNTASEHNRLNFAVPIAFTAGSRVIKLQWKVSDALTTATVDIYDFRCFTLIG